MQGKRSAIALLITIMFTTVISLAIAYGLKQVNSASKVVQDEKFMYQSNIIVEDVLNILKNSPEIKSVIDSNTSEDFYLFLSQAAFIPLSVAGLDIVLKIESARGKFNPSEIDKKNIAQIRQYLNKYNINDQYLWILVDNISGIKEDNSYNSAIFDEKPYLFRDYIVNKKHLQEINSFYTNEYNDNNLKNINFSNLFYYTSDKNTTIDLNYATTEVWEMMLGVSKERAEFLSAGMGSYNKLEDIELDDDEAENLKLFHTSFFEPLIFVEIEIKLNESEAKISFEYDIKTQKGSNFVYEI